MKVQELFEENSKDLNGKTHKGCGGKFQETSIRDDWDGVLHCTKCKMEVDRYVSPTKQQKLTEGAWLIENKDDSSLGSLSITPNGNDFIVRASAKSGPIVQGIFHVWKQFVGKRGIKISMMSGKEVGKMDGLKILDNRPQALVFTGVDKTALEAAVRAAEAKVAKDVKAQEKRKAEAPARRAADAKFAAEKRKTDMAEYDKKYGKGTWNRVTYKQEGGDDGYSYVVRVDGKTKWNGLTQRQAQFYKQQEVEAIAKRERLGQFAA